VDSILKSPFATVLRLTQLGVESDIPRMNCGWTRGELGNVYFKETYEGDAT
jgi:hypothetical protein